MTEASKPSEIRKFNPGIFQSDEELKKQFVVRTGELDTVLSALRRSYFLRHVLVTGPRGAGKTMLLARVAAELRADDEFWLYPVRFTEESHEIMDSGDFWLEALFHLVHETAERTPDLSHDLAGAHERLASEWRDDKRDELYREARETVLDAADRLGRTLVLMVENLPDLWRDVDDDFERELREALQNERRILLLGTAIESFEGSNLFQVYVSLEPLNTDDCGRLWKRVSREAVKEREIKPLEILTGGNPRLLVIVAQLVRRRSLRDYLSERDLMEELVGLIDEHTEYFRSHLQGLAKTERRVYLALLDLWRPSTTGEVAARARMDVRVVSAMLGRLVHQRNMVRPVEGGDETRRKKQLYAATEGLYSIYYKLRRSGRSEAARVRYLLRFMAVFYTDSELADPIEEPGNEPNRMYLLRSDLSPEETYVADPGRDYELKEREVAKWLNKGVAPSEPETAGSDIERCDKLIERLGHSEALGDQEQVAKAMVYKGVTLWQRKEFAREIDVYDQLVERYGDSDAPAVQEQVAKALDNKGITLRRQGKATSEIAAYEEIVTRLAHSPALAIQEWVAEAQLRVDRPEEALRICDELEADKGFRWRAAFIKTRALFKQGNNRAAMDAFARYVYPDFRLGVDDETTMRKMQTWLIELISAGVQQRRLLEILLTDKERAAALEPMIAALRRDMNLQVRVPAEVQEVANDIFEAIRNQRALADARRLVRDHLIGDDPP